MKPASLVSALALACMAAAPAAAVPTTYRYVVHDLVNTNLWPPTPTVDLDGLFTGEDLNADGVIARDELTSFFFGNKQMFPSVTTEFISNICIPIPDISVCLRKSNLAGFSYDTRTGDFDAHASYPSDERTEWFIDTGRAAGNTGFQGGDQIYWWGPGTYVTVQAIPEPATAGLLALGLVALGAASRRRAT